MLKLKDFGLYSITDRKLSKKGVVNDVLKAGAKNIAIISEIVAKDDVEKAVRGYIKKLIYKN